MVAVCLVLAAATARIVNAEMQLYNFVPVAAISLFSGALLKQNRPLAFLIPLLGQFVADIYFQLFTFTPGFYSIIDQVFTYGAIAGAASIGLLMKNIRPVAAILGLLGASAVFFIVSNLGYFLNGWNGYSVQGLVKTYVDAIPFYRNSFVADMLGGVVLFGGYFTVRRMLAAKAVTARV